MTIRSSSRHYYSPPVVEVKPSYYDSKSTSTPSPPGSPKAVRFTREAVTKPEPQIWSKAEAWSLHYFECHARQCRDCYSPQDFDQLCRTGKYLARNVDDHMHYLDGDVYSRQKEHDKYVRIHIQPEYSHGRQLLKAIERESRMSYRVEQPSRTSHRASYAVRTPSPPRRAIRDDAYFYGQSRRDDVVHEPARAHGKSKSKSSNYKTVAPDDDYAVYFSRHMQPKVRQGSQQQNTEERLRREKPYVQIRW